MPWVGVMMHPVALPKIENDRVRLAVNAVIVALAYFFGHTLITGKPDYVPAVIGSVLTAILFIGMATGLAYLVRRKDRRTAAVSASSSNEERS